MSLFHTPGPWKARKIDDQCWAIDSNGDPNMGHESWTDMVIVYGCDDQPDAGSVVAEANARLIAQAPELFRIASELAAIAEELENSNSGAEEYACRLARQAQTTIAKAIEAST